MLTFNDIFLQQGKQNQCTFAGKLVNGSFVFYWRREKWKDGESSSSGIKNRFSGWGQVGIEALLICEVHNSIEANSPSTDHHIERPNIRTSIKLPTVSNRIALSFCLLSFLFTVVSRLLSITDCCEKCCSLVWSQILNKTGRHSECTSLFRDVCRKWHSNTFIVRIHR